MPRKETVADVIDLEPVGTTPPRNAEAASESIEQLALGSDAAEPPIENAPPVVIKPKRRTKAELEAEVTRLASELERQRQQQAANAPNLIKAMEQPLSLTFRSAGNIMAAWKGEHWKLQDAECSLLAEAWAPVVGPLLATHPEAVLWASAIGATYSVAYPRIQRDRTEAAKAKLRGAVDGTADAEVTTP